MLPLEDVHHLETDLGAIAGIAIGAIAEIAIGAMTGDNIMAGETMIMMTTIETGQAIAAAGEMIIMTITEEDRGHRKITGTLTEMHTGIMM